MNNSDAQKNNVGTIIKMVDGSPGILTDTEEYKRFVSMNYNFIYRKSDGLFLRWGAKKEDDGDLEVGLPEIADIEISTVCSGINGKPCAFCSPAQTFINKIDEEEAIEKIKVGDKVYGFDLENNEERINIVEEVYEREFIGELIILEFEDGKKLKLTPNHRVFLFDGSEKRADQLREEDEIIKIKESKNI